MNTSLKNEKQYVIYTSLKTSNNWNKSYKICLRLLHWNVTVLGEIKEDLTKWRAIKDSCVGSWTEYF